MALSVYHSGRETSVEVRHCIAIAASLIKATSHLRDENSAASFEEHMVCATELLMFLRDPSTLSS